MATVTRVSDEVWADDFAASVDPITGDERADYAERYADLYDEALREAFPDAEIVVNVRRGVVGSAPQPTIEVADGDVGAEDDALDTINQIAHRVHEDGRWAV